jgi:hypothetical protein
MARSKRTSKTIIKAERRAAGIESISPDLDLGNGMTLKSYQADIEQARDREIEYNKMLSSLDKFYNEMLDSERQLADRSSKMLQAIAIVYGRNSSEYEMAGGTRTSERRRFSPTAATTESAA